MPIGSRQTSSGDDLPRALKLNVLVYKGKIRSLLTFACSCFVLRFLQDFNFKLRSPYIGLPLCSQDSSDHHSAIILRWQTPKIVCNINTHLTLKGLKNFLSDSIWQISLVKIFPQGAGHTITNFFLPRSLTRQYYWLTKIMWDVTHAILRVGEEILIWENLSTSSSAAKKFTSEKCWKIVCFPGLFTSKLQQGPFSWEKYFVEVVVNCVCTLWVSNCGVGSAGCARNFTKTSSWS